MLSTFQAASLIFITLSIMLAFSTVRSFSRLASLPIKKSFHSHILSASQFMSSTSSSSSSESNDTVVSRCTEKITHLLKPVKVSVTSTNSDPNGSHIQVLCISTEFEGKTLVQRQRLVYKALWDELNGPVHAVDSIVAKTPKEMGL